MIGSDVNTTSLSLRFLFTVVVVRIFAIAIFRLTFRNIVRYFHEMSVEISFQGETFRLQLREISCEILLESLGEQRTKFVEFLCITFAQYCMIGVTSLL